MTRAYFPPSKKSVNNRIAESYTKQDPKVPDATDNWWYFFALTDTCRSDERYTPDSKHRLNTFSSLTATGQQSTWRAA